MIEASHLGRSSRCGRLKLNRSLRVPKVKVKRATKDRQADLPTAKPDMQGLCESCSYPDSRDARGAGWYVSELLAELGISKPNLSQHLAILRNSGVVTTSRVGKQLSCTLAMPEVKTACELIRNVLRKQVDEGRKLIV